MFETTSEKAVGVAGVIVVGYFAYNKFGGDEASKASKKDADDKTDDNTKKTWSANTWGAAILGLAVAGLVGYVVYDSMKSKGGASMDGTGGSLEMTNMAPVQPRFTTTATQ